MLQFINTSLLSSKAQTLVNTVNTAGVMGKGLAKAFKDRHPSMYTKYKHLCEQDLLDVGKLWLWKGADQWVLNFPTKRHWKYPSKLAYVEAGLQKFVEKYDEQGIREIAFPRLGCGNGGLNWAEVRPLMEQFLRPLPIRIFVHDFEADIGAPEHSVGKPAPFRRSFHAFLDDLRALIHQRSHQFRTVSQNSVFRAHLSQEGDLLIARAGRASESRVAADEMFEAWQMLLHGPLTKDRLVGSARSESSYVLGVVGTLPYVRAIQLRNEEDAVPGVALEIVGDLAEAGELLHAFVEPQHADLPKQSRRAHSALGRGT